MSVRPTFIVVDPDGKQLRCSDWGIARHRLMPRLVQAWAYRQSWRGSCAITHKEINREGRSVFEWTCLTNGKSGTFTIDKLEQPACTP